MSEIDMFEIIPKNATIRQEFVKCGKFDCDKKHGPYYYAYWKEKGKLKKRYIGKDYAEGIKRLVCLLIGGLDRDCNYTVYKKVDYIIEKSKKGVKIAQEYESKLEKDKVTVGWAYKQVKNEIDTMRYYKMCRIAEIKGYQFDDPYELFSFVSNEMESKDLDIDDEDALESYLNSEFR